MDEHFNVRNYLDLNSLNEEQINRCEFWTTANRLVRQSGKCNFEGERIEVNDKWNLNRLEEWLVDYHDRELVNLLRYGWPLNAKDTAQQDDVPENQKGAKQNPEKIKAYLKEEIENGSVIGPFIKNPFGSAARFSPLDTRPKKNSEDLRVILNLSHPFRGDSVNHSIDKEVYADGSEMNLKYPSVDDLAKIVRIKGRGAKIFIRDLRKAYRQLFMCPGSIHLLGYIFEDKMYFDVSLSMGSKSSAYCCQRTTDSITYIYGKYGYSDVNYLDDLGAAEQEDKAQEAYDCLGWIMDTIGIQESKNKATVPAVIAIFLGILFNTLSMTLQITDDRLDEIKQLLRTWETKSTMTLQELQSLLGKLNFACNTVRSGRVFVSRIINELKNFKYGRKRVSQQLKQDINWWARFMEDFDGITIMPPVAWDAPDKIFATDACLHSCGGWTQTGNVAQAFCAKFPEWLKQDNDVHINELELLTFIIAIKKWGESMQNRNILAFCDNQVSVDVVNSGAASNRFSQACLREICFLMAKLNAVLKLVHLKGQDNRICDSLSRWGETGQEERFYKLTEGIHVEFVKINDTDFEFSNGW